jgi:capsular polysaccharide biosynthesis protein
MLATGLIQKFLKYFIYLTGSEKALKKLLFIARESNDSSAIVATCNKLLTKNPTHKNALLILAFYRLEADDAIAAVELYQRIEDINSTAIRNEASAVMRYADSIMEPEKWKKRIPYVANLRNVFVDTEFWSVLDGEKVYNAEVYGRNIENCSFVQGRVTRNRKNIIYVIPKQKQSIEHQCILLGGDSNYCHWVTRSLLKLALLDGDIANEGHRFLINDNLFPFQKEYLELLGIPEQHLIKVAPGSVVSCSEIMVPTLLRNHPKMILGINWLRERLKRLMANLENANDMVYLSRRDSKHHVLVNELELEAELSLRGFKIVLASTISVAEQINIFSKARVLISPHGAGLTNIIFSPLHAKIIEIASSSIFPMNDFRFIAGQIGQEMHTVICSNYVKTCNQPKNDAHRDYVVDIKRVLTLLDSFGLQ